VCAATIHSSIENILPIRTWNKSCRGEIQEYGIRLSHLKRTPPVVAVDSTSKLVLPHSVSRSDYVGSSIHVCDVFIRLPIRPISGNTNSKKTARQYQKKIFDHKPSTINRLFSLDIDNVYRGVHRYDPPPSHIFQRRG
jgi:hypothetical protein